jgi:hypothetical protein
MTAFEHQASSGKTARPSSSKPITEKFATESPTIGLKMEQTHSMKPAARNHAGTISDYSSGVMPFHHRAVGSCRLA